MQMSDPSMQHPCSSALPHFRQRVPFLLVGLDLRPDGAQLLRRTLLHPRAHRHRRVEATRHGGTAGAQFNALKNVSYTFTEKFTKPEFQNEISTN